MCRLGYDREYVHWVVRVGWAMIANSASLRTRQNMDDRVSYSLVNKGVTVPPPSSIEESVKQSEAKLSSV